MVKIPNVWKNSVCPSLLMHSIIRLLCTECLCSLQIHMLKSFPQCDGIRRQGLWKVVKIRWTHEGRVFMNGISAFRRINNNVSFLSPLSTICGYNEMSDFCKPEDTLPRSCPYWHSDSTMVCYQDEVTQLRFKFQTVWF